MISKNKSEELGRAKQGGREPTQWCVVSLVSTVGNGNLLPLALLVGPFTGLAKKFI